MNMEILLTKGFALCSTYEKIDLTRIWIDMWGMLGDTWAKNHALPRESSCFCLQMFLSKFGQTYEVSYV